MVPPARSTSASPSTGGPARVDAHQHFWRLGGHAYPWLTPDQGPIYRDFGPADLEPLLQAAGISHTITVQAANSCADTDAMLAQAERYPWIAAVIGWIPLLDPAAAARALEGYVGHPAFRGVRHLVHDEPDPDWLLAAGVSQSLRLLAEHQLVFEIPAAFPRHLIHVPWLARQAPDLKIVIDHLAKPPIASGELQPWAAQLAAAAACPNVYAKLSGLSTEAGPEWGAEDLQPFVAVALQQFGADRLMLGSDWPVCLMAGDYELVWSETLRALDGQSEAVHEALEGSTAARVYSLVL